MDNSKLANHQKVTVVCTDFNVYLNGIRLTGARPETAKLAERCGEKLITLSLVVTDLMTIEHLRWRIWQRRLRWLIKHWTGRKSISINLINNVSQSVID